MRTVGLAGFVAIAIAAALAGCGGSEESDTSGSLKEVKVGIIPIASVAPLYLGMEQGYFADEGLKIEPQAAQGGAAIVPAVVSNQWQFGFSNVVSLMIANDKGLGVTAVSPGVSGARNKAKATSGMVVPEGSPIQSLKDLAGKTVAVNTLKNIDTVSIEYMLQEAGVDSASVKLVEVPFPEMVPALEAKRVDAASMVEPFVDQALAAGGEVIGNRYLAVSPLLTVAVWLTSDELIEQDPEMVQGFKRAMDRSLEYAQAHPDAVHAILPTYTKIPADVAKDIKLNTWSTKFNVPSLETVGEVAAAQGLIGKPASVDELIYAGS